MNLADADADLSAINSTDRLVLYIISNDGPLTSKALANAAGVSTRQIRHCTQRLLKSGHIQKLPDLNNARSVVYEAKLKPKAKG